MRNSDLSASIEAVRRFNRFYTRQIGVLDESLLKSRFSLAEARVIYELAARETTTATELRIELGLDAGYLSRLLKGLEKLKIIEKKGAETDGRQNLLSLSARGHLEFAKLDKVTRDQIGRILTGLSETGRRKTVAAMKTIEDLLDGQSESRDGSYILRPPQPGDLGWVVQINGRVYADEYGWDETYEAAIAQIVADFVKNFDPKKERCWIAEKDGENVGSVFLVKKSSTVAKLRVLILDPKARGLGIGKRLVDECTRFARQAGYKKITLWTNSILLAARGIYKQAGYKMIASESNRLFGHDLVSETWELKL